MGMAKDPPPRKICHMYPTMMKLGSYTLLEKDKKYMNHVAYPLSSADMSLFSPEISKFCLMKKYMHRLHVHKETYNSFNFS